jgi:hypothetical protein
MLSLFRSVENGGPALRLSHSTKNHRIFGLVILNGNSDPQQEFSSSALFLLRDLRVLRGVTRFSTRILHRTQRMCDQLTDFRQGKASVEPSDAAKRCFRCFAALKTVGLRFACPTLQKVIASLGWSSCLETAAYQEFRSPDAFFLRDLRVLRGATCFSTRRSRSRRCAEKHHGWREIVPSVGLDAVA